GIGGVATTCGRSAAGDASVVRRRTARTPYPRTRSADPGRSGPAGRRAETLNNPWRETVYQ
nr:hypothetical protein [Tanacetum cinerariifolium]